MPLLGTAAMLLAFDVAKDAATEHDDWHTHEHLPERLSIPGFLRGTRWVRRSGQQPAYLVLYEVEGLATLTSAAYRERLDNPTAWTSRMMPHYRGMRRGFCAVAGSFGVGLGHAAALVRFEPPADAADPLRARLIREVLPHLPGKVGISGAHLLESALTPEMTSEQRLRGADAGIDWAIILAGYAEDAVFQVAADILVPQLQEVGARELLPGDYRLDYSLARWDARADAGPLPASGCGLLNKLQLER
jgi:hypothetical protein